MSRLLSAACGRACASFVCLALWSALAALPVEPLAARTHSQNVIPGAPSGIQGQPEKNKRTETSPPAAAMLAADKGKFRILLDGQPVGSEEFEISPEGGQWVARGSTQIRLPAGGKGGDAGPSSVQVSGRLKLAADGTPLHYEWSTQAQKKASATVDFQGGTARIELLLEGAKPFVQELSFGTPRVLILDNNLYHHYAVLARLYDWNTRGAQDRKSTRLNSSHIQKSRMPSSA